MNPIKHFGLKFAGFSCAFTSTPEFYRYIKKYYGETTVSITEVQNKDISATCVVSHKNGSFGYSSLNIHQHNLKFRINIQGTLHFYYPLLSNILQRMYASLFYAYGGIVLHGSAVLANNQAYLFLGPSGSGKTTIARVSEMNHGYQILADNHLFLKSSDEGVFLYPFPFDTFHNRNPIHRSYPVANAFFILQSNTNKITPLDFKQARSCFTANVQIQTSQFGDETANTLWEKALFSLFASGKLSLLHFRKDGLFWKLINGKKQSTDR